MQNVNIGIAALQLNIWIREKQFTTTIFLISKNRIEIIYLDK